METLEFLDNVVTTETGNLLLCLKNHVVPWTEEFYSWPQDKDKVQGRLTTLRDSYDIYFTSHLFNGQQSTKEQVIPTRTIQADLDFAQEYPLDPSILVQTSPNRFQGYWILKYDVEPEQLERLSKRLTYAIDNSDHSGWSLGHRLRLPGSLNFKYNNGPYNVEVLSAPLTKYAPEDIELLPATNAAVIAIHDNNFLDQATTLTYDIGPYELMHQLQAKVPNAVYMNYIGKVVAEDRSGALWNLMCSLFEAGCTREQVFWLAKHSVNNKFAADMRFNSERELAKDVTRAEQKVKVKPVDVKAAIDHVRSMPMPNVSGGALIKRRQIYFAVKFAMEHTGKLVKVIAGLPYFIPNDSGRPIPLTPGSEHFRAILHLKYGINSADPEYKYVHDGIIDEGISIQNEIQESTLSFFDGETLYFHTGRKEVLKITTQGITKTDNGECGILFPWHDIFEPFSLADPYDGDWAEAVFGDLHNTTNMTPEQARALLKCWLIFSLFRSQISTRPILAFFGPPGSSKSTIPHRIYALLYARRLAVSGVSGASDFDTTSSKLPIYCIDNLDSYISWIIDKLAQAIGNIDILKRKLFTDVDVIRQRRQAMIVVTAHNPKFTREDVTSRLVLITLDEIAGFRLADETAMINHIVKHRSALWASILQDVIRVLNTPKPSTSTVKWRIQDFALLGEWIATALGCQSEFNTGLASILNTQSDTVIQQEELLSSALQEIVVTEPVTSNQLWNMLLIQVGANQTSFIHTYKNPIRLAQKLINMRAALSHVLDISVETDPATRIKKWSIKHK